MKQLAPGSRLRTKLQTAEAKCKPGQIARALCKTLKPLSVREVGGRPRLEFFPDRFWLICGVIGTLYLGGLENAPETVRQSGKSSKTSETVSHVTRGPNPLEAPRLLAGEVGGHFRLEFFPDRFWLICGLDSEGRPQGPDNALNYKLLRKSEATSPRVKITH